MSSDKLIGVLNISNVPESLEQEVLMFQERYGLSSKAAAAKMLLREGVESVKGKKSLRILPTS